MQNVSYVDCIGTAILRHMERDERIVVLGEDVHRLRGGTFGGTRGVTDRFPDRLFAPPIAENGFVGMAPGASQNRLRTEMGRSSLRERGWPDVEIWGAA